jgi:predicted transcriptional regulator
MLDVRLTNKENTDKGSVLNINDRATQLASFFGIKTKPARMPNLGSRELEVMELFWERQQSRLSVQQVLDLLLQKQHESIGLNTMQSTLERLNRKKLLSRDKHGRAFLYCAVCTKQEVIQRLFHDIAEDMTKGDILPMISGFMEYVASQDPALCSRLESALPSNVVLHAKNNPDTQLK